MAIKLVVSDMDGSLLNDKKEFPPHVWEDLHALEEKGITFAAASGRSYPKQRADFKDGPESMWFICDNGACVIHRDEVLFTDCIDREGVKELARALDEIDDIMPVFCGVKGAWHKPCPEHYKKYLTSYYISEIIIQDAEEIDDDILKIAICDLKGSAAHSYPALFPQFGERYHLVVSGPIWMDIMNPSVNKGRALQFVQQKLGVSKAETMAFGDYYNDVELLLNAGESYVMENANDDMKPYGSHIAPPNNEWGVMQVLHREFLDRE